MQPSYQKKPERSYVASDIVLGSFVIFFFLLGVFLTLIGLAFAATVIGGFIDDKSFTMIFALPAFFFLWLGIFIIKKSVIRRLEPEIGTIEKTNSRAIK